jgi:hypothetical protein
MPIAINQRPDGFGVLPPRALNPQFKATFSSARWDAGAREWVVAPALGSG